MKIIKQSLHSYQKLKHTHLVSVIGSILFKLDTAAKKFSYWNELLELHIEKFWLGD